jgi:hypothetical protein
MHLEARLRQAELVPDPTYFQEYIADDAILDGRSWRREWSTRTGPVRAKRFVDRDGVLA